MDAVRVLTAIGLEVRALTSDGAAVNRKFFNMMANSTKNCYWTWNPHNPSKKLFFFSDVPHLIKTTRNFFENSKWNRNTRNMHVYIHTCMFRVFRFHFEFSKKFLVVLIR